MTKTLENIVKAATDAGKPIKNLESIAVGLYDGDDDAILYYDNRIYTGVKVPKSMIDTNDCTIDHIKIWRTWEANL